MPLSSISMLLSILGFTATHAVALPTACTGLKLGHNPLTVNALSGQPLNLDLELHAYGLDHVATIAPLEPPAEPLLLNAANPRTQVSNSFVITTGEPLQLTGFVQPADCLNLSIVSEPGSSNTTALMPRGLTVDHKVLFRIRAASATGTVLASMLIQYTYDAFEETFSKARFLQAVNPIHADLTWFENQHEVTMDIASAAMGTVIRCALDARGKITGILDHTGTDFN
jgi:hypothetical protein